VADLERRHPAEVPLPPDWGGYALRPAWIEFWENRRRPPARQASLRSLEGGRMAPRAARTVS